MAVREKDISNTRQLRSTSPHVERQSGRTHAKPGLLAGPRSALDRQILEAQGGDGHRADQISRKTQRRSVCTRWETSSQSGSISHKEAATDDNSELPS